MTPLYPSSSSSVEKEEDDQILKLYIFSSTSQASSSQLPYATQHDQRGIHLQGSLQLPHDHKAEKSMVSAGGSSDDCQVITSTFLLKSTVSCGNNEPREALDSSRDDHQELEDHSKPDDGSAKNWMSSKMRLMQKMMINTNKKAAANSDHKPASRICTQNLGSHRYGRWETRSCSSYNNGVRVCSDCNTTTTPLWRSGPQGPKSLCNACGIRQRKARRAMAEAANGGSVVLTMDAPSGKQNKEKKSRTSYHDADDDIVTGNEKNKCSKITDNSNSDSQSEGNISFDNFTVSLSKTSSAFRRVFPRDEEEAAILLMELSCGLVHSC